MKRTLKITAIILCTLMLFSLVCCSGKKTDETEIKVGVLKGATGIGTIKLKKDSDDGKTEGKYSIEFYETANVSSLNKDLINGTVDIAAIPVNAGGAIFNKNDGKVQVIAVNALGVLSIVGKEEMLSFSDLKNKQIHTTGQASTPEYILNYLLTENGLDPENDVQIIYYADGSQALKGMLENGGVAMLPEPATSAALAKNKDIQIIFDITEEWEKVSDTALVQGCLVANREFVKEHPEAIKTFLEEYAKSVDYVNQNISEAAVLLMDYGIIESAAVAKAAIPRSNTVCITGSMMKNTVEGMLDVLYKANPESIGGKMPGQEYYYDE